MNSAQRERWHSLLHAIDAAETERQIEHVQSLAEGYLLDLFDVRVFDEPERAALQKEVLTRNTTSTLFDA